MKSYNDLKNSYGRCLAEGNFLEGFYEIFKASHPDITSMFGKTDFEVHRNALRRGISLSIWYAADSAVSHQLTDRIAGNHTRDGRAPVPLHLYPFWVDSLVRAVKEMDPKATPQLLERWREAMSLATEAFVAQRY